MRIDWNDPAAFTVDAVRALIGSVDDGASRQIRVSEDGIVYIADIDDNRLVKVGSGYRAHAAETEPGDRMVGVRAFLDVWKKGGDYFGADAAAEQDWPRIIYTQLTIARDRGVRGFIDIYDEVDSNT